MTRVDFYILEPTSAREHDIFICRLTDKAWRQGHQVHILCADDAQAEAIDGLLWTFHDTSFVPHVPVERCCDTPAPVSLGSGDEVPPVTDVLINLKPDVPECFSRFDRVVETTGPDGQTRQTARIRYRFYQQRGYPLKTHTIDLRHD